MEKIEQIKLEKLLQHIKETAGEETAQEESNDSYFDIQDISGGNFDDAYEIGTVDGQIEYARELLEILLFV